MEEVFIYNNEFSKQMKNIIEGHTQNYYTLSENNFNFKDFLFFYEFSNNHPKLRNCYLAFKPNGDFILKHKKIDLNLMDELKKINNYLFVENKIENFKRYFNELNYFNEVKKLLDINEIISDESIIDDYKEELNIDSDINDYIEKKQRK